MKTVLLFLLLITLIYIVFSLFKFIEKVKISKEIVNTTKKFEVLSSDLTKTILVLGDSTAVGVGAKESENSVPGRVFFYEKATFLENKSVSGAKIIDLESQIESLTLKKYDLILIMIGGNDIIRFTNINTAKAQLLNFLKKLPEYDKLIVVSAANVGSANLFPFFIPHLHQCLNMRYHTMFTNTIDKVENAKYVNLYEDKSKDLFYLSPEIYLSKDGLHPSDAGYEQWFDRIKNYLIFK